LFAALAHGLVLNDRLRWQFLLLSKLPDRLRDWVIAERFG
jgi:hypothetical protein